MNPTEQKWPDNLVVVRHGESERNVLRNEVYEAGGLEYGGGVRNADVPLTERGVEQARQTGRHLATRFHFSRVVTSPYVRTQETAKLIAAQFPYAVETVLEERIREREFGMMDALTRMGFEHKYPDEWKRRLREGKYYYRPPGGESYPDVALRVHSFLGALSRDYVAKSVLVVCHSVVVLVFRQLLERLTEEELLRMDAQAEQGVCNCSVSWYAFDPAAGAAGKLSLREFNGVYYEPQFASNPECRQKAQQGSAA